MNIKTVIKTIRDNMPPQCQHLGTSYHTVHNFFRKAQWWPKEEIESWQLDRIQKVVRFAYEQTEGYRQLYDESHVKPEDIQTLADVSLLPFTDKELLRDNVKVFTAKHAKSRSLSKATTGGSTGMPFSFYVDKDNLWAEFGFMYNAWESIGWKESDKGILLRGSYIGDKDSLMKKLGYHRWALSSNFITEDNYEKYVSLIKKFNASFLHVYPSTITDLSHLIINHKDEGKLGVKHIFLGSENLYSWQKETICRAFPHAKLMSWYGHTERAIWAPWCEKEERYHLNPFYGYNEILNGNEPVSEGESGELVGTAFWMFGTPFIRYRTNDFAEKGPAFCEKCGRQFQLLNHIDGRLSEIIVGKSGRRISLTIFAGSIMHGRTFDHIKQFRFIQKEVGSLVLSIVPSELFDSEDLSHLNNSLKLFLGDDFSYEITKVDSLQKSKNGKFSYLEQHLSIDRADNIKY